MFSTRQRIAVRSQDQRKKVISSVQSGSNFSSSANVSVSSPGMSNQKDTFLSGILPSTDDAMLRGYYRDIYDFDHVSGAAVDLLSSLPFSDWTLVGADDGQLAVFNSAMDRLNFRSLLPELSIDYLVLGVFIATLVYKREAKQFTDIIPHNPDDIIQGIPSPIYSADPHLQLRVGKSLKDLATGQDAYNTGLRARLNDSMVASLKHNLVTLDPLTTLYLPRKTYSVSGGTSFYRRILPIFLLERLLYRGTLTEATRRQRSILHITAGDEFWEPTEEELLGLVTLFQQADLDPIGAMIATRNDVQTTELRAAGEFWRYTDIVESTTVMKLRAMGISESFLCLTGDTLVSTNAGLVRLDSFGDHLKMEKDSSIDVDFQLKGKDGRVVNACKWWYRGKNAVKKVTTYSGYNIKGTASHKILVLADGATTEWKTIQELMPNQDRLCVDLNSADKNRRKSLRLTLSDPEINAHQTNLKIPNKPKVMTPELAYVMGMIISEGSLGKYGASISNSDDAIIERYRACVNKVFGLGLGIYIPKVVIGETMPICGIDCTRNVVPKEVSVHSKVVAKWLNELGVNWTERKNEKSPCCSYAIPWSILKADDESKFSFLAAYIDGDGRVAVKPTKDGVKNVEISIYSGSYPIIQMLQILLSDLGIKSRILHEHHRLVIPPSSGGYLYSRISKYMGCERKKLQDYNATPLDVKSGIPLSCFEQLLKSRHIRREVNVGEWFENDEGKPTLVERYGQRCKISVGVNKDRSNAGLLLYDSFDDGVYDDLLCLIKQISTKLHTNLLRLFQIRYLFDPVVSVEDKGKKHLFDLTVDSNSPPAFVANGIVVHNSGEANYNCVVGDTLIPTSRGIMRIDQIADEKHGKKQDIQLPVLGMKGKEIAQTWLSLGKAPTIRVFTTSGNNLECTPNHKLLTVRGGKQEWVAAKDIRIDDYIAVQTSKLTRKTPLPLKLVGPQIASMDYSSNRYAPPEVMTPDLAFVLGCIVSEGCVWSKDQAFSFANTNQAYLDKYEACLRSVFPQVVITKTSVGVGRVVAVNGREGVSNYPCYTYIVTSKVIVHYLKQLGVVSKRGNRSPSYYKQVPWSVLQADEISQFAFLAAYIEGDGTISKVGEIYFASSSRTLVKQIQAMVNSFGILCRRRTNRVVLNGKDAQHLWAFIKPHMVHKSLDEDKEFQTRETYGVPYDFVRDKLLESKLRRGGGGIIYRNDQQQEIPIQERNFWDFFRRTRNCILPYDSYDAGTYNDFLSNLKSISKVTHARLIALFNGRYNWVKVTKLQSGFMKPVYDLSMNGTLKQVLKDGKYTEPAYVANGLISHNTAEVALSVFIEGLRAYRLNLTRRLFTNKLFPLISVVNGFYKQDKVQASVNPYLATAAAQNQSLTQDIQFEMNDTSKLVIPEVHWHKQLKPQADRDYMELLTMLEEKGVPITLRMWAAAGGLSLDNIKDDMEEDTKLRKELKELKGKSGAANPEDGGEGGEGEEEYALSSVMGRKPRSILSRDYGEQAEIIGKTKTGRPKVVNQRRENERANVSIAKAMQNLSDEEHLAQVLSTTSRKIRL